MPSLKDIMPEVEKAAHTAGSYGGSFELVPRIPTGLFAVDLTIGGGLPRGRMVEFYGPEGSGKTNLALKAIAANQRLAPEQTNVFIDMEGTWDPHWATALGVDATKVFVIRPDFAEQVSDMVDKILEADDIGVMVLDSLAAMGTLKELEEDTDNSFMGQSARVIKRMTQKATRRLKVQRDNGKERTCFIVINQTRTKLGVVYGDPESTPGGNSPKFAYSLRLRLWGKANIDKTISDVLPVSRETKVLVKKHKVAITAMAAEFDFIMLKHGNFTIGDCDDWNMTEEILKVLGWLEKAGTKWTLEKETYPTIKSIREKYQTDADWRFALQQRIITARVNATGFVLPKTAGEDADEYFNPATGEFIEVKHAA